MHTHTSGSHLALSLNLPVTERTDLGKKNENKKTLFSPYLATKLLRLCVFGNWRAGCHILHLHHQILFVTITMVAPVDPRKERSQELEWLEQLKDSEKVLVHLFTDVY